MPSPGMNTTVNIHCRSCQTQSLKVPAGGIFEKDGQSYVYVILDGRLERREVSPVQFLTDGGAIVTSSELTEGEVVVASGVHRLSEGQTVKTLKEASSTNVGGLL